MNVRRFVLVIDETVKKDDERQVSGDGWVLELRSMFPTPEALPDQWENCEERLIAKHSKRIPDEDWKKAEQLGLSSSCVVAFGSGRPLYQEIVSVLDNDRAFELLWYEINRQRKVHAKWSEFFLEYQDKLGDLLSGDTEHGNSTDTEAFQRLSGLKLAALKADAP